ncbi:yippee zinc-binding/DNA-binding /Mis18, centromere assembly-domain-containing protein [Xylariomycetidae sp. FL0641]|nr:yippee zinc-binding/DNA-binding /Mis18, centromere assembly-domain-containing protein [Xylariomycetidae sp. FL0641]
MPPPPPPTAVNSGPKFPVYLLPSFSRSFRRRRQSSMSSPGNAANDDPPSLSNSPTGSPLSSPLESLPSPSFFPSRFSLSKNPFRRASSDAIEDPKLARVNPNTIRCSTCGTDLAYSSQIVSKGFTGRYGRAYLVAPPERQKRKASTDLVNIKTGNAEPRLLVTGAHVVADIACATCHTKVGWKYVDAKEESQKYKVGKFILETQRTVDFRSWDDAVVDEVGDLDSKQPNPPGDDFIVFDSDDEEECEDLFAGTWDPDVVAQRRSSRVQNRRRKLTFG